MKVALILSLLTTSSLPVFASNEGPHGTPTIPSYVLAEKSWHTGMISPPYQYVKGIRIYSDGSVNTYIKHFQESPNDGEKTVTHLSTQDMSGILKSVAAIKDTTLIDHDAGKPMCMDTPSTAYFVRLSSNTDPVTVRRFSSCHSYGLKDDEGKEVANYLDQLDHFANPNPAAKK